MFNNSHSPENSMSIQTFISHIPGIMLNLFPIVVLMSVILSLVNTLRTPANKFFAAFFTLITASIIYYAGYTGLYLLDKHSNPENIVKANHLYTGKLNPLSNSKVYLNKIDSNILAIEISDNSSETAFRILKNAAFNPENSILTSEKKEAILIEPENPFFSEILTPPDLFKNLINDLSIFNTAIRNIFEKSHYLFILTILSQIAFAIGCWTIIKLSKWPFLNGLLAIAVIRLFPAYYRLSYSELTQKAIGFLETSNASDLAPVAILITTALLLFLWDILYIKNKNMVKTND